MSPAQLVFVFLLVVGAYLIGSLSTEVRYLKGGQKVPSAGTSTGDGLRGLFGMKSPSPTSPSAANSGSSGSPTKEGSAATTVEPLRDNDHIRGDREARLLLIEYSDLECPFCKRFHPTAQQVVDSYNGKVAWVYRHFPIDQLHPKGDKEAEAAECAQELAGENGFWKLVDKIFEVTPSNNGLNLDDLPTLASQVGLSADKFKQCLDSGKYAQYVEDDYQSGLRAGVSGTPGNILLDTKTGKTRVIPGAVPFEQLKTAIDTMLSEG